jgi:hypothetical protein
MLHSQTHPYSNPRLDAEEFRPILVEKFNLFCLWGSRLLWPSYGQAMAKPTKNGDSLGISRLQHHTTWDSIKHGRFSLGVHAGGFQPAYVGI